MGDGLDVRIVTESEVRENVSLDTAIQYTRRALTAKVNGLTVNSSISHLDVAPNGELHIKGAAVDGADVFAAKMSTGFPGNTTRGLPPADGFTAVFDSATGQLRTVILDGGYLTELRTAAAGAIALDLFSAPDAERIVIVGAGGQARHQLAAARHVRPNARITVVGRRQTAVDAVVAWARDHQHGTVTAATNLPAAVRTGDAIVTTTYAREPLILATDLRSHAHITAVGADSPGKRELSPDVLTEAALFAADDLTQSRTHGELQGIDTTLLRYAPTSLGEIIRQAGTRPNGITIADLTGLGIEDAAMAEAIFHHLERTA